MYIPSLGTSPVDLQVALRDMLQRTGGMDDVILDFHDTEYLNVNPEVIHDLVMSVQEAVSNARRHGHARKIVVGWESTDWEFHLWIEDDGIGFDPDQNDVSHHFGLANMARRIERLAGVIDVTSGNQQGTVIQFRWPKT
jgi:signal transduction histidine kinase